MFQGDEFTLQKFKSIINSEDDLQRFKDILGTQRERILDDIHGEKNTMLRQMKNVIGKDFVQHGGGKKKSMQAHYLPLTFEGMMESFGINL